MQSSNEEKTPRQWAKEIAALPVLSERRAKLNEVPENLRAIVETHLTITWAHKKHS